MKRPNAYGYRWTKVRLSFLNESPLCVMCQEQGRITLSLTTSHYRHGIQTEAKSQEKVIEYREILKKELTCDLPVPQPIADGVLGDTYELREMYADPQNTNRTSVSTTTTSTLTYCQVAL
ncbi:TPA: hypothetical protein ACS70C_002470 [Providencia alcalifaciens]